MAEMVQKMGQGNILSFMQLFLHATLFGENFISEVEETLYFSMLEF